MTPFASVALFRRDKAVVFKAPRKEASPEKTQARKSAARYWRAAIAAPDQLARIVIAQADASSLHVSERRDRGWFNYRLSHAEALKQPHLAACLTELGVDTTALPPALPDVLEINGVIYRREI